MCVGEFTRTDAQDPLEVARHVALVRKAALVRNAGQCPFMVMLADEFLRAVDP